MCGNCDGGDELWNSMAAVSVVACCLGVASGCRGASWFIGFKKSGPGARAYVYTVVLGFFGPVYL
jgi:hypothetical protein